MKIADINELLSPLNVQISECEDYFTIEKNGIKTSMDKWKVNKQELEEILSTINSRILNDLSLYDDNNYEIVVHVPSSIRYQEAFKEDFIIYDDQNKIAYELSEASSYYIFSLMYNLNSLKVLPQCKLLRDLRFRFNENIHYLSIDYASFLDVIKLESDIYTLKIKSENKQNFSFFQELASSFLFNACYTLDEPIIEIKTLTDILDSNYSKSTSKFEKVNPPHRLYNQKLVYYYQIGISGETPGFKFLSQYHILEYFFKAVYDEFLVSKVKNIITRPEFSYCNDEKIQDLINQILNTTKSKAPTTDYNEQKALELVLRKYVPTEKVSLISQKCGSDLVNYYKTQKVSFSNGSKVDFNADENAFYESLASRIYKTRNSIVHNKAGETYKYVPYEHGEELNKELPLLKYVCQEIIIESALLFDSQKK